MWLVRSYKGEMNDYMDTSFSRVVMGREKKVGRCWLHCGVVLPEQDLSGAMLGIRLNPRKSMGSLLSPGLLALLTHCSCYQHGLTERAGTCIIFGVKGS